MKTGFAASIDRRVYSVVVERIKHRPIELSNSRFGRSMHPIGKSTTVHYRSTLSAQSFEERLRGLEEKTSNDPNSKLHVYPAENSLRIEYVPYRRLESTPTYVGTANVRRSGNHEVFLSATFSVPRYLVITQWVLLVPVTLFGLLGVIVAISGIAQALDSNSSGSQAITLIGTGILMTVAAIGALMWVTDSGYPSELSRLLETELELAAMPQIESG